MAKMIFTKMDTRIGTCKYGPSVACLLVNNVQCNFYYTYLIIVTVIY